MRLKLLVTLIIAGAAVAVLATEDIQETLAGQLARLTDDPALVDSGGPEQGHAEGHEGEGHHRQHKIIVTRPQSRDVTLTESYVCQIHSRRHIELRALEEGYLDEVLVNEGQRVSEGDLLFRIVPILYQANLDSDLAEAQLAQVEYNNSKSLVDQNIVSVQDLKLAEAKLAKAKARVERASAELSFTNIKAPFSGIVHRLEEQKGSLLEEGAVLTSLSDNEVMWVYFNVPEAKYLEYQHALASDTQPGSLDIELKLANHKIFDQPGVIGAIEAEFNNETGNIAFRADFPNPNGLLRHGQTGTVLMHHEESGAIVIPQRAMFEILAKTYVYVVDEAGVAHQREIKIGHEQDDIFVISEGLDASDKIVLEGLRQVRDGQTLDFDFQDPESVLSNLKYHAE